MIWPEFLNATHLANYSAVNPKGFRAVKSTVLLRHTHCVNSICIEHFVKRTRGTEEQKQTRTEEGKRPLPTSGPARDLTTAIEAHSPSDQQVIIGANVTYAQEASRLNPGITKCGVREMRG